MSAGVPLVYDVDRAGRDQVRGLDRSTRTRMELAFGHDLGTVRVHTGPAAAAATQAHGASAFTAGEDVHIAPGRYDPDTEDGVRLLAHELTHVIQQRLGDGTRKHGLPSGRALEAEADRAATAVVEARPVGRLRPAVHVGIQRQQAPPAPAPPVAVPGISTPLEPAFQARAGGGRTLDIHGVQVIVEPDRTSRARNLRGRAITEINFRWRTRGPDRNGQGARVQVEARISTTYGQGVNRTSRSGYGRGTTAADVRAANTTLGFHEGSHGRDYIEYLRDHPFPRLAVAGQVTQREYNRAYAAFRTAAAQYRRDIDAFSLARTDCVGTTIDQFENRQGGARMCRQVAPAAP